MRQVPPLNALKSFDAAARHLNFSNAAEELHVTHGAVSRQVSALEAYFRISLFVRGPRKLSLTAQGIQLAQSVNCAFETLRSAGDLLQSTVKSELPLRISAPPTLAMWWLMSRLSAFDNNGETERKIELSTSIEPVDFEHDSYDAAIRRISSIPRGMHGERFLDARSVPVCSPQYQLRNQLNSPEDLVSATLLVTRTENNAWDDWFRFHKKKRAAGAPAKVFDQLYFAVAAAIDSLGVALVPIKLVDKEIGNGTLCIVVPSSVPTRRSYTLLCPRTSPKLDEILAFGQWLKNEGHSV